MYNYKLILGFLLSLTFISCKEDNPKKTTALKTTDTIENKAYEIVIDELSIPWGFVFLPDHSILITEKNGELIHYKDDSRTIIQGLPKITVLGQGGLMDIELHPNYKSNGWIYISYVSSEGEGRGGNTSIMRFKIKDNKAIEQDILYKANPNSKRGQHFGSRIAFDKDNYLYFSIGDRGNRDVNPQNLEKDCGKIYRLYDDGRIPEDNPFVNKHHAKKAIYSYGHRNPQGMVFNPETNTIWTHEHGPKGGDEINIIKSGANYGWPIVSYGVNYSGTKFTNLTQKEGMIQPIHHWTPSIAPSGMSFLNSDKYPNWKGNLFVGSLKFQYLNRIELSGNKIIKEEKLLEGLGRVRCIEEGPDGYLYIGIENLGIVKLYPNK